MSVWCLLVAGCWLLVKQKRNLQSETGPLVRYLTGNQPDDQVTNGEIYEKKDIHIMFHVFGAMPHRSGGGR